MLCPSATNGSSNQTARAKNLGHRVYTMKERMQALGVHGGDFATGEDEEDVEVADKEFEHEHGRVQTMKIQHNNFSPERRWKL